MTCSHVSHGQSHDTWANFSQKSFRKHCNYGGLKGARLHALCFVKDLILAWFSIISL